MASIVQWGYILSFSYRVVVFLLPFSDMCKFYSGCIEDQLGAMSPYAMWAVVSSTFCFGCVFFPSRID